MSLADNFAEKLRDSRDVAANNYLTFLHESVKSLDRSAEIECLKPYLKQLEEYINNPKFPLCADITNDFAQVLGEAHFLIMAKERGIPLQRIPETTNKTPDFKHYSDKCELFFEVKTLSVVDGDRGIQAALESSLDAQIQIENQLQAGSGIASAISEIQPYGLKPYKTGTLTAIIDTLLEKIRNNIKNEQFSNPNTFLVVNLSIIPPYRTDNMVLRPAYCDDYMFSKALTGELWMTAFAKPGMLIHGTPEFEGKPCVESIIDKMGVLSDPDFCNIAGILFMIHPWQLPAEIWGLFRSEDLKKWECESPTTIMETVLSLTGTDWNDDNDSNGWRLDGRGIS